MTVPAGNYDTCRCRQTKESVWGHSRGTGGHESPESLGTRHLLSHRCWLPAPETSNWRWSTSFQDTLLASHRTVTSERLATEWVAHVGWPPLILCISPKTVPWTIKRFAISFGVGLMMADPAGLNMESLLKNPNELALVTDGAGNNPLCSLTDVRGSLWLNEVDNSGNWFKIVTWINLRRPFDS